VVVPLGEEDRDPQLCKPYASNIYSTLAERSSCSLRCGQPVSFHLLPSPCRSGGPPAVDNTLPGGCAAPRCCSRVKLRRAPFPDASPPTVPHRTTSTCNTMARARSALAAIGAQICVSRSPTTPAPSLVSRRQPCCILSTSPLPTVLFPRPGQGLPCFPPFSYSGKPPRRRRKALSATSSFR
jgi:hypothetical protein